MEDITGEEAPDGDKSKGEVTPADTITSGFLLAKVTLPTSGKTITAKKESLDRAFQLIEAWGRSGYKQSTISPRTIEATDDEVKVAMDMDHSAIPYAESRIEASTLV